MNTNDEAMRPDADDCLPMVVQTRAVVQAERVYDGELVDDQPNAPRRAVTHRFMNWWQRSRRVPAALKSAPAGRQALRGHLILVDGSLSGSERLVC